MVLKHYQHGKHEVRRAAVEALPALPAYISKATEVPADEIKMCPRKKDSQRMSQVLEILVGMRGFEPPASASRTLRSSQTEPHPAGDSTYTLPNINATPFLVVKAAYLT